MLVLSARMSAGSVFDDSRVVGSPLVMSAGVRIRGVCEGLEEGLLSMRPGGVRLLVRGPSSQPTRLLERPTAMQKYIILTMPQTRSDHVSAAGLLLRARPLQAVPNDLAFGKRVMFGSIGIVPAGARHSSRHHLICLHQQSLFAQAWRPGSLRA